MRFVLCDNLLLRGRACLHDSCWSHIESSIRKMYHSCKRTWCTHLQNCTNYFLATFNNMFWNNTRTKQQFPDIISPHVKTHHTLVRICKWSWLLMCDHQLIIFFTHNSSKLPVWPQSRLKSVWFQLAPLPISAKTWKINISNWKRTSCRQAIGKMLPKPWELV